MQTAHARRSILILALCLSAPCTIALFGKEISEPSNETSCSDLDIPGREKSQETILQQRYRALKPVTDNMGNVIITIGSGKPFRVIATAVDEPGYVVSGITEDGYLRVQRIPQTAPNGSFDALHFAQPVWIAAGKDKRVNGVFAGLSVHLQSGRTNAPRMNNLEDLYIDIGAKTAEEVRAAGVDLLDAVYLQNNWQWFGPGEPDREGGSGSPVPRAAAGTGSGEFLLSGAVERVLDEINSGRAKAPQGTITFVFLTQSSVGSRGLNRFLQDHSVDEMIYVGRIKPQLTETKAGAALRADIGIELLLGVSGQQTPLPEFATRLKALSEQNNIPLKIIAAEKPALTSYAKPSDFPNNFLQLGIETLWPETPAETVSFVDAKNLQFLLGDYLGFQTTRPQWVMGDRPGGESEHTILEDLVVIYGASGHEEAVREKVKQLLPDWAKKKVNTDAAGNLVLHLGDGKRDAKTPSVAFVAHMDELGFEVKKIEDDGRLLGESLGGGYPQYFLGHVALVHKKDGTNTGGVVELPDGWEKPGFEFPVTMKSIDEPAHLYVGTRSKEETEKLGIAAGDYVTVSKEYRPLLGTRASVRSFDDRVGCAALIAAVRALGPELPGRDVTFVWSTEEEVGLKGAAAFAEQATRENRVPDFVFAIDTFVSSDSPLESKRFADAELGKGFVIRAVDNSNIVPLQYVDRVIALAKEGGIPVQFGVTGGGNDGAVFTRYGSVDVPLGWPLRYSHSPAEVIDTKDLDALGKIIEALARKW